MVLRCPERWLLFLGKSLVTQPPLPPPVILLLEESEQWEARTVEGDAGLGM